jgi:hypothetical protein
MSVCKAQQLRYDRLEKKSLTNVNALFTPRWLSESQALLSHFNAQPQ